MRGPIHRGHGDTLDLVQRDPGGLPGAGANQIGQAQVFGEGLGPVHEVDAVLPAGFAEALVLLNESTGVEGLSKQRRSGFCAGFLFGQEGAFQGLKSEPGSAGNPLTGEGLVESTPHIPEQGLGLGAGLFGLQLELDGHDLGTHAGGPVKSAGDFGGLGRLDHQPGGLGTRPALIPEGADSRGERHKTLTRTIQCDSGQVSKLLQVDVLLGIVGAVRGRQCSVDQGEFRNGDVIIQILCQDGAWQAQHGNG